MRMLAMVAWAQKVVAEPRVNAAATPPIRARGGDAPRWRAQRRVARAVQSRVTTAIGTLIRFSRSAGVPMGTSRMNR